MFFFFPRSNDECNKKQPSDCDTLEYRNGEGTRNLSRQNYLFSLLTKKKENDNVSLSWPFVPSLCITSHARAMGAYIYFFIICLEVTMAIY